jgi:hypothetical protein
MSSAGADPKAFGGGAADALGVLAKQSDQLAGQLEQTAQLERHRDAARKARDSMTAYSAGRRDILYGDGTPEHPGYMNYKGQVALDKHAETVDALTKLRQGISDGLDQDSRDLFDSASMGELNGDLDRAANYSYSQKLTADEATDDSAIEEASNMIQSNPYDPKNVNTQRAIIQGRIEEKMIRRGVAVGSEEWTNTKYKADSAAIEAGIESIAISDTAENAKKFYAVYKDSLRPDDQAKVEAAIKKSEREERADRANQRAEQTYQREETERKEGNRLISAYVDGTLDSKQVAASGASESRKMAMINALESDAAAGGKVIHSDPVVYSNLLRGVYAKDSDPTKIWDQDPIIQAMIDRKISRTDGDYLLKALDGKAKDPESQAEADLLDGTRKAAYAGLVHEGAFDVPDPENHANYNAWLIDFQANYRNGRRKGIPASRLLDPRDNEFVGKWENYKRPPEEIYGGTSAEIFSGGIVTDPAKVPPNFFKTQEDVRTAYHEGKIDIDTAKFIIKRDGLKHRPTAESEGKF